MALRRAFACVLLLAAGCGGDAFSAGSGGGSNDGGTESDGGGSGATGGKGSAGSGNAGASRGGTSSAGSSSGGSASGGSASGGMSMGGTESGGTDSSGSSSGGMSSGGDGGSSGSTTTCSMEMDCTSCAYPTAPMNDGDCYCVGCADTPMNVSSCNDNQKHWEKYCANAMMPCPAVKCLPSLPPSCNKGRCVDAL